MTTTIILKILLIIIAVIVILLHFSVIVYVRGGTSGKFEIRVKYLGITLYPRKKKPKKPKKKRRKKARKEEKKEEDILEEALEESSEEVSGFEDAELITESEDEESSPVESIAEDKPSETLTEETAEDTSSDDTSAEEISVEETSVEEISAEEVSEDKPENAPADGKKKKRRRKKKKKKEKPAKDEDKSESGEKGGKLDGLKKKWEFIKPYIPPAWKYTKKFMKAIRIEDVKILIETGKEDAAESATFYGKLQAALFNTLNMLAMIFTLRVKEANVHCLFNVKKLDAEGEATVKVRPSTMIAIAFCLLFCAAKIFIPYKLKQRRARKKAEKEAKKNAAVSAVTEETA